MAYPIVPVKLPADLQGKKNGALPASVLAEVPGGKLHKKAAVAWKAMIAAAAKDGVKLEPTSVVDTYRPLNIQVKTFLTHYQPTFRLGTKPKRYLGKLWWLRKGYAPAAVPGTSNHGWGLAVDVKSVGIGGRLAWLLKHAAFYGFSWEAQSEAWHIRYVCGDDVPPYRRKK